MNFKATALLGLLGALFCGVCCLAAPSSYLIESLPGLSTKPSFKQYSGLIKTINPSDKHEKNFFFWFVESQRTPSKDPVVLWLNGGPGASSLIGFLTEHGPFRPVFKTTPATIEEYSWSWNKVANVLYLEQPVSVGFSWSSHSSDWTEVTDESVGENVADFLAGWFKQFPEFAKSNSFYLSGESYGGHYIPSIATELLKRRNAGDTSVPPIAGLLVGNPATHADWFLDRNTAEIKDTDGWPFMSTLASFGFVSRVDYMRCREACGWKDEGASCPTPGTPINNSPDCVTAINTALYRWPVANIDLYNLDAPVCLNSNGRPAEITRLGSQSNKFSPRTSSSTEPCNVGDDPYNPCLWGQMVAWLNRLDVQKALHVNQTLPVTWNAMSNVMSYNMDSMFSDATQHYRNYFADAGAKNWRILIYSGISDAAVPSRGTERWVRCLGRPIKKDWRSWTIDEQVAGLVIDYDRISYLTIRTTGHTVPSYTPQKGFEFFARWIDNKAI